MLKYSTLCTCGCCNGHISWVPLWLDEIVSEYNTVSFSVHHFLFIARFPSPFFGGAFPFRRATLFISSLKSACSSLSVEETPSLHFISLSSHKCNSRRSKDTVLATTSEPYFMALLTVSNELALAEAGNSALTSSVFHGYAGNFGLCACLLHVRHSMLTQLAQFGKKVIVNRAWNRALVESTFIYILVVKSTILSKANILILWGEDKEVSFSFRCGS